MDSSGKIRTSCYFRFRSSAGGPRNGLAFEDSETDTVLAAPDTVTNVGVDQSWWKYLAVLLVLSVVVVMHGFAGCFRRQEI